ncbi:hypothetical protein [Streptomyces scabiei]|uniref:hypothetical protein n=1 Tax=Streptomyces scabiei TaxID=1930 RepID=UPI000765E174|nr:hypothetical protein [Streptomyces scabiei]
MTGPWRRLLHRVERQLRREDRPGPRHAARPSFTCPRCTRTSHHPLDRRYGYCSACNDYTGAPTS